MKLIDFRGGGYWKGLCFIKSSEESTKQPHTRIGLARFKTILDLDQWQLLGTLCRDSLERSLRALPESPEKSRLGLGRYIVLLIQGGFKA